MAQKTPYVCSEADMVLLFWTNCGVGTGLPVAWTVTVEVSVTTDEELRESITMVS